MRSVESIDCKNLTQGSVLDVETMSRHYQIECLGGNAIRISGHPEYCPSPVAGRLEGSVDVTGGVEAGRIECGRRLRLVLGNDCPMTTSRVLSVHVEQAA